MAFGIFLHPSGCVGEPGLRFIKTDFFPRGISNDPVVGGEIQVELEISAAGNLRPGENSGGPFHMLAFESAFSREIDGENTTIEPLIEFGRNFLQATQRRVRTADVALWNFPTDPASWRRGSTMPQVVEIDVFSDESVRGFPW